MQEPTEVWPPLWMAHLERAHDATARALPLLEEGEAVPADLEGFERALQIGRASCRERVFVGV